MGDKFLLCIIHTLLQNDTREKNTHEKIATTYCTLLSGTHIMDYFNRQLLSFSANLIQKSPFNCRKPFQTLIFSHTNRQNWHCFFRLKLCSCKHELTVEFCHKTITSCCLTYFSVILIEHAVDSYYICFWSFLKEIQASYTTSVQFAYLNENTCLRLPFVGKWWQCQNAFSVFNVYLWIFS